jgi:hypothetical protein
MFPEIARDKSESEHARQQLESALQAAWDTIDESHFDCLYKSIPSRIKARIAIVFVYKHTHNDVIARADPAPTRRTEELTPIAYGNALYTIPRVAHHVAQYQRAVAKYCKVFSFSAYTYTSAVRNASSLL